MKLHWDIFISFFRVGMLGFGGGPASIPLIQKEVVEKYGWMTEEEFGDVLAIANTLPGPIATKLAGYIGYRVSGFWGMVNAIVANIAPTIVLLIVLLTTLSSFKEYDWVQGMAAGVIPVVGMMMAVLTWQFVKKTQAGFGWPRTIIYGAILFIILQWLHVHPGIVIAVLLVLALSVNDRKKEGESK
ncbi:putative transporter YwrB [Compostibacillus humi]|jgi:chromate transporter|uniref:Putative transporter YwrB n=1 Tax=Compostibacillus humi TaxID=1245525 RepID=A0A8J3EIJ7_9BACI|nr:chromate transporter [Compostibacillus humi]GGH71473.1 putative transporter YwrB [Compostibacillus humi]HLT56612.1 chromate transporter [Bacillota bacterium]